MRIIIVTQDYPSESDPVRGIFIHHQALALQSRGHQVEVYHYIRRTPFRRLQKRVYPGSGVYQGVSTKRVFYYWPSRQIFDWGWCSAIALVLRKEIDIKPSEEPTVIYAQWLLPTTAACLRLRQLLRTPVVGIARGYDLDVLPLRSHYLRAELDLVWRKSDLLLVNGEWALQRLQDLGYNLSLRRVQVIRNVRDFSAFLDKPRLAKDDGPLKVITVAALEDHKGIDMLLRAVAALRDLDLRIDVVGDGSRRLAFEAMARDLSLGDRILFHGKLPPFKIVQILADSHIFILPSRREGVPNALIEAMASGLACVAPAVGGIPEVIEDGVSGLLVPREDVGALAKAIQLLAQDEMMRQRLGQQARERVCALYSYERNLSRLEQALASVVSTRAG